VRFLKPFYLTVLCCLAGCASGIAREALTLQAEALQQRRLQTRRFDTVDEERLLSAALDVLQDLGFAVDEATPQLGVLVVSKNRDADSTGEIVGSFIIGAVSDSEVIYNVEQKIRASVVTRVVKNRHSTLRVTFQRTVWNNRGEISDNESIDDPAVYQEFFSKLSKAVFLRAQELQTL
jgi:hypothetical protein